MGASTVSALLAAFFVAAAPPPVIVIDPGHGGDQLGAPSPIGYYEKDLTLLIAHKLERALAQTLQATVILTRDSDVSVSLADRVKIANDANADLFISLHANSMLTSKRRLTTSGVETYFLSATALDEGARLIAARENAELPTSDADAGRDPVEQLLEELTLSEAHRDSSALAYAVHRAIIAATKAKDRGVRQAPFLVLMGLKAPAVLLEVGFVSHPQETRRLMQKPYQELIAKAVADGVKEFLSSVAYRR